jgi:CBS domain-containing protein
MLGTKTQPKVGDVMTHVVVSVEPEMTVKEAAALLSQRHISGAPVISRKGEILGIVSVQDILRAQTADEEREDEADSPLDEVTVESPPRPHGVATDARPVLDIATRKVVALDENTPLDEAAKLLLDLGIHRALVTRSGKFAGIVTATDILKWVARPALEAES